MSGRRANGEGTITKRKDGRYQGAAYLLMSDGTRRRKFVYGKTREEVHERLTALMTRSHRGLPASIERWTVERYLLHWHAEVVGSRLRATTLSGYGIVIRIHLIPAFGSKVLDRLTPQDVRRLLARAREQGLSVRMVQYIHAVLRNALQHAVREEILARNVAKLVQVETPDYEVGRGLSVEEAGRLLAVVADTRWRAVYVLALMLGLRRGELLGLRWADIDWDATELTIRQTVQRVDGELRYQPPKTRKSRRTLPMPGPVVTALRQHRSQQAAVRLASGAGWKDTGLVFTTGLGTPIEPRNLSRHFYSVREGAGLAGVRLHDLRHTCITLLLDLGTPPHIVQAIAGHSHIDVTMTIYAHAVMDEQRAALRRLGERLAPGN